MQDKYFNAESSDSHNDPLAAWFLGPKAEHAGIWGEMINYIFQDYVHWRRNYFLEDPIILNRIKRREHDHWFDKLTSEVDSVLNQLKSHFPFFSPRYVAHMLSEQTLPSVLGYFAGMLYNPNNVTNEAAPITVPLEIEVGKMVSKMLGYNPQTAWAHITSGGTVANIEALWVARTAQFNALMVQEFCKKENIDYQVVLANGAMASVSEAGIQDLLHLSSDEAILLVRKLASHLSKNDEGDYYLRKLNRFFKESRFNVNNTGILKIHDEIKMSPLIYVSEAAHYSVKKAANILGYGENAVVAVPVDSKFRMDADALKEMLFNQKPENYTACVIGIAGTTEEGAVDPLRKIQQVRNDLQVEKNRSFWFHIDAAWGGYLRSLFTHPGLEAIQSVDLNELAGQYADALDVKEIYSIHIKGVDTGIQTAISWDDPELYKSFLSFPEADSITVDPHKMGYIPYPCGIVAFKNEVVTELITQKAQYISDERGGIYDVDKPVTINAVGPFILEGSKPGAAAAAAWLAHKTIPLETFGHGKIIRTSLLNTRKLLDYLQKHEALFKIIEKSLFEEEEMCANPFTFKAVYDQTDTNVICYVAVPAEWDGENLVIKAVPLQELNTLNKNLYNRLTIRSNDTKRLLHAQEYFVSKTWFESSQYAASSVKTLWKNLKISEAEYTETGIFVLRSTIMNPWYFTAEEAGKDYLMDFVLTLHSYTRGLLNDE